jgi:hypothetical protein
MLVFFWRQFEEVCSGADSPALCFQSRAFILFVVCVPTQYRRIVESGFMLIPALIFLIGLAAVLVLAPVFSRPFDRRTQKRRFGLLFGTAILLGYIFGGTLVWSFVPSEWPLSFGETLAASVDATTYGHPIEHYAESILVVMLFACLAGALIGVAVTAMTARIWRRNRLRTSSIIP